MFSLFDDRVVISRQTLLFGIYTLLLFGIYTLLPERVGVPTHGKYESTSLTERPEFITCQTYLHVSLGPLSTPTNFGFPTELVTRLHFQVRHWTCYTVQDGRFQLQDPK